MKLKNKFKDPLIIMLVILILLLLSWIVTCGLIKLVTLCFGWNFSWRIATGIWIVIFLLKDIFNGVKK